MIETSQHLHISGGWHGLSQLAKPLDAFPFTGTQSWLHWTVSVCSFRFREIQRKSNLNLTDIFTRLSIRHLPKISWIDTSFSPRKPGFIFRKVQTGLKTPSNSKCDRTSQPASQHDFTISTFKRHFVVFGTAAYFCFQSVPRNSELTMLMRRLWSAL
jgi:hypothetical protein